MFPFEKWNFIQVVFIQNEGQQTMASRPNLVGHSFFYLVLLEHSHTPSFACFMAVFVLQHSWVVVTETVWPAKPNRFSIWTLTEILLTLDLEKAMATHSSTLAWQIPWTEETAGLQSMGSRRVGHDWATSLSLFTFMHWRKRQPTPVFLPGESQGWGSLVGCCLWGRTESWLKWLSSLVAAALEKSKT